MTAAISFDPIYSVYLPPVAVNGLRKTDAIHQCHTARVLESVWSDGIRASWLEASHELKDAMETARLAILWGRGAA